MYIRPNLNPTPNAEKLKVTRAKTATTPMDEPTPSQPDEAKFMGCYGSESSFIDRIYEGGSTGANFNLALHHAKTNRKRYFAVARGGSDGHAFAFSSLDNSKGTLNTGGCERPCLDFESKVCGCMDGACTGPIPKGEEHNRRWAVYKLT